MTLFHICIRTTNTLEDAVYNCFLQRDSTIAIIVIEKHENALTP